MALLSDLGVITPVLAAPMAGGATTPDSVTAAGAAGSLGFLAAGYKSAADVAGQIASVRGAGVPFGVNVFAPNPLPVDPAAYREYARVLRPEAERLGVDLPPAPREDDDEWPAKIDLLLASPVPLVSFTFGLPERATIAALRRAGSVVVQTVTSVAEALAAAEAGIDVLAVQGFGAGGHSGTFTPRVPLEPLPLPGLVARVRSAVPTPLVAAGGVGTAEDVAAALRAGAEAVMVGTALLRTDESSASAVHRAALADPAFRETVFTRAFTGRPARGLRNRFIDEYEELAPFGYPAVHHLTGGLRRAAAAAGDAQGVHLWAGTGFRHARTGPIKHVLTALAAKL